MCVAKKEEMVPMAQTHALYMPDARFPNGSRAATKWHETIRNKSFVHKVLDSPCLL